MPATESAVAAFSFKVIWPVVPGLAAALIGFGMLRNDVAALKAAQSAQPVLTEQVIRLDERVKRMETDVTEIKGDVKQIAEAVK